jgi:6-phosphogluconolactonase
MTPRAFPDPETLAIAAAESFKTLALEAVQTRGFFTVALSGGSTPRIIYEALSRLEGVPWGGVHVFWGDDRLVPPDDSRSNYAMTKTVLLDHVDMPDANIHRIRGELEAREAVAEYARQLEAVFGAAMIFDLVHLGVGPDGHTASLFPATPNLESPEPVRETFPTPGLQPQIPRVTLSLGVINAARVKQFFVTGSSKKAILERIARGEDLPAARVIGAQWWLDVAAQP